MIISKSYIAFLLFFVFGWNPTEKETCETSIEIEVLHPGIDLQETISKQLIRSTCNADTPVEYYMDVESVVCGDSQCKIDITRLYWDALGFYNRIELPENVYLEKAEGAHFTTADYQKLDSILADANSTLKDVYKYEVTGNETSEGVDALSGATIALDTETYVKGAVWTSYTLWHWVNGSAVTSIRNTTADALTNQELIGYLKKEDEAHQEFALEQVIRKKINAKDEVLALTNSKNKEVQKLIIRYAEQLPSEAYFASIEKLVASTNNDIVLLGLQSLQQQKNIPTPYLETLGKQLTSWDSYQKINNFLHILEKQISVSNMTQNQVAELLEHSNFLIARRAYWFLSQQEVSRKTQSQLKKFNKQFSAKL